MAECQSVFASLQRELGLPKAAVKHRHGVTDDRVALRAASESSEGRRHFQLEHAQAFSFVVGNGSHHFFSPSSYLLQTS